MAQQVYSIDPGASGRAVSNRTKKMVEKELKEKRLEHSMSLETQSRLFRTVDTHASTIWSRAIQAEKLFPQ